MNVTSSKTETGRAQGENKQILNNKYDKWIEARMKGAMEEYRW